jgi:hypothetical protein
MAEDEPVQLVTADKKLRGIVRDITERRNVNESVTISNPRSVL